ncbi:hypothetical protein BS47DRAFT_1378456 [Hydnum rufescens UP504]|uniref:Transcriptional coactivator p15 (PC4) C-terminal domain-containing protein n=1 Tax=Hydnum rufescens UP504 TaxID=1448309 RepID=A0A9P6E2G7_9AGAM|nr:hypothetical protein BS47DRAFT_1378456 [Hydnum rufescens UP504]
MAKRKAEDVDNNSESEAVASSDEEVQEKKKKVKKTTEKKPKELKEPKKESKAKKQRQKPEPTADEDEEASGGGAEGQVLEGEGGEKYISLGNLRRAAITGFKGKVYVNIREYYEDKKDGQEKPGKKGIMLSLEQWEVLKRNAAKLDTLIAQTK